MFVWHDGDFPFGNEKPPACLHHCDVAQFRKFADEVEAMQRAETEK